jgi:hypothetical protein
VCFAEIWGSAADSDVSFIRLEAGLALPTPFTVSLDMLVKAANRLHSLTF